MDTENKYIVIDYLYNFNLNLVKAYSDSIYNSLNVGWQNYITNKDRSKNKKYKDKIEKNLDKLAKKEKKDNSFIKDTLSAIDGLQEHNLLNYKFKKILVSNIKELDSISEYFRYLLNKYDEIIEFTDKKNKDEKIEIPYKINDKEYYVQDNDGYYYYHVKMVNGSMKAVPSSLKAEKMLYKNALKDDKKIFKEIKKDFKLSPFEKQRRIYIENIFSLEKQIYKLFEKRVDITYPVEKYYEYSKYIIDGLYKELNRTIDKNGVLDYIMQVTIDNFNYEEVCNNYSKGVKKFNSEINKVDKIIKIELTDETDKLKEKGKYSIFKNTNGIVPTVGDIYSIVNQMIIEKLDKNVEDNHLKMNEFILNNTKYMKEKELLDYYNEYKNILIMKECNTDCFIVLQKSIVNIFVKRFHIDSKDVFSNYIKEEKLY